MKRFFLYIALITTCLWSCSAPKNIAVTRSLVIQIIQSRDYTVEADYMSPMRSEGARHLSASYSLAIHGDTLVSYLPYYGEAFGNIPYGGGNGLNFTAEILEYNCSFDDKGTALIEIKVRNENINYKYLTQIFGNGNASISINSDNRQPISFRGKLKTEGYELKPQ
ncbi:MAG: DUF4251 domain-containing protein [Tannerella sp.]|jgi:hypothetical protein|nr:DUF4251 domain-containing protein [Tannerella sp.]